MHEHLKKTLLELSVALQDLHRNLLMLEAQAVEAASGQKLNPYDLLHKSLHDPGFSWLRLMSAMIVHVDTIVDETPQLNAQQASIIADEVLNLLEKPDARANQEFWNKYSAYLSHNPDIIMKHSRVKTLLESLRPQM